MTRDLGNKLMHAVAKGEGYTASIGHTGLLIGSPMSG